jgi:hypothetical protein
MWQLQDTQASRTRSASQATCCPWLSVVAMDGVNDMVSGVFPTSVMLTFVKNKLDHIFLASKEDS